jgi:hypothetical protein
MSQSEAQEITQMSIEFNSKIVAIKQHLEELVSVLNATVGEMTSIFDSAFDMYFKMVKYKTDFRNSQVANAVQLSPVKENAKRTKKEKTPVGILVLQTAEKNIVPMPIKKRTKKLKIETVLESGNVLVSENKNEIKSDEYVAL